MSSQEEPEPERAPAQGDPPGGEAGGEAPRGASTRRRLEGRVMLITGGGTGIGRATALLCAREGARIIVAGHLDDYLTIFRTTVAGTPMADDDRVLDRYGSVAIDSQALKLLGFRALAKTRRGIESTEQSILKLFGSESFQNVMRDSVEILGPAALDNTRHAAPDAPLQYDTYNTSWFNRYVRTFGATIAGGTSEVSSNIVGVSNASNEAGMAAAAVLSASDALRREADVLRAEIDAFLSNIRAA